jgi:hypothetical protein
MEFKDKFVAYIDILGFKNLVKNAELGNGSLDHIIRVIGLLGNKGIRGAIEAHGHTICPGAKYSEKHLAFQVTQVSDCAIITWETSPAGCINLIQHCWKAVLSLLQKGLMCRGYITRGNVYHDQENNHIIGGGYQEAYSRES